MQRIIHHLHSEAGKASNKHRSETHVSCLFPLYYIILHSPLPLISASVVLFIIREGKIERRLDGRRQVVVWIGGVISRVKIEAAITLSHQRQG